MPKQLVIFIDKSELHFCPYLSALVNGLNKHNIKYKHINPGPGIPKNIKSIVYGINPISQMIMSLTPTIAFENSYFRFKHDYYGLQYYTINGLPKDTSPDRYETHFKLNDEININTNVSNCLILGQVPSDNQHGLDKDKMIQTYDKFINDYYNLFEYFHFRPHPKFTNLHPSLNDKLIIFDNVNDLHDVLNDYSTVYSINSTGLYHALIKDKMIITENFPPWNQFKPFYIDDDKRLHLLSEDNLPNLYRSANACFSLEEFENGDFINTPDFQEFLQL